MTGGALLRAVLVAMSFVLSSCGSSFLYRPDPQVVAPDLPGVRSVRVMTEDGESLVAWHLAPRADEPVFLFFDGTGGRPQAWNARWQRMAARGAGFLAVYYRGYSGSTGHPSEAGLHRDARAGYDWLIAHGYEPADIVIHGFSLGSAVAVNLARERPARALILEAPMTGIDEIAASHFPLAPLFISDTFRAREWIEDVHMPVLIVHGDADRVVPFDQGERLFTLAHEPKEFVRMTGSEHVTLVRDGIYAHIAVFLSQHPGGEHGRTQNTENQGLSRTVSGGG